MVRADGKFEAYHGSQELKGRGPGQSFGVEFRV